jgi:hypothetical protein
LFSNQKWPRPLISRCASRSFTLPTAVGPLIRLALWVPYIPVVFHLGPYARSACCVRPRPRHHKCDGAAPSTLASNTHQLVLSSPVVTIPTELFEPDLTSHAEYF